MLSEYIPSLWKRQQEFLSPLVCRSCQSPFPGKGDLACASIQRWQTAAIHHNGIAFTCDTSIPPIRRIS